MPIQRLRRSRFISHLGDSAPARPRRSAFLPEEAEDAGGTSDRLSALGGLLGLVAIVTALAMLMTWLVPH